MKKINLKFEHGRLVFAVDDKEFYIDAADLLGLLDGRRVSGIFHELDPAVIFAGWDTLDFVSRFTALKEKGYTIDEIAEYEGTTKERLENWQTERAGLIQQIKDRSPSNFRAAVTGAGERIKNKKE